VGNQDYEIEVATTRTGGHGKEDGADLTVVARRRVGYGYSADGMELQGNQGAHARNDCVVNPIIIGSKSRTLDPRRRMKRPGEGGAKKKGRRR